MSSHAWIAPIVLVGLWIVSLLWTLVTAPGLNVQGQHVFITGATKGLGLALAKKYAQRGAKLTLVGRSIDRLQKARAAIEAAVTGDSVAIYVHQVDLTEPEAVAHAIAEANAFHGRPTDHVVCAASVARRGFFADSASVDLMHHVMDVNYYTAVHVVKCALPAMIEHNVQGRVVLVSSTEAFHTPLDSVLVSGASFALKGFAEALRNELKLYGMRVHVFYPGTFRTTYSATPIISKTPSTPVPGEDSTVDYATFADAGSSTSAAECDALAESLLGGMKAGQVSITTGLAGFYLRSLSNGVVPRKNSMFELMVLPLMAIVGGVVSLFTESPSQAHKDAAASRVAEAPIASL